MIHKQIIELLVARHPTKHTHVINMHIINITFLSTSCVVVYLVDRVEWVASIATNTYRVNWDHEVNKG